MPDLAAAILDVIAQAPDPGNGAPPPGSDEVLTILRWAAWLCLSVCVIGVMAAGARMAFARSGHGHGGEEATRLGWVLAGCILIGSASALVGALI